MVMLDCLINRLNEVGSRTSSTTRSAKNSPLDMAEDAEVDGNGNGSDDEMVEKSPFRKSSGAREYFTSLRSDADSASFAKRWVSLDSFWPLLKLSVKGTIGKAIKQSSYRAMQGSHPNQSLRKLTLYRYNKLSSRQVYGTYKLA